MKSFLKSAVSKVLSRRVLIPPASRVIFALHDVSEKTAPQYSGLYSTEPARFREQIDFLRENFRLVSLDEIVSSGDKKSRLAAVTFDDGFLSVKDEATPYLERHEIPYAVFVNKTAIERNYLPYDQFDEINRRYDERVFLNAEEIKRFHENGVTVGSHTANHRTLSNCDEPALHEEVGGNKEFLENLIGAPVAHLAIPYGKREHYNQFALDFCAAAGHRFAYSTNPVYFSAPREADAAQPVPRVGLTNQTAAELCFLINRPLFKKIDI